MKIKGLFVGKKRPLGPRGQSSGIFKNPVDEVEVDVNGIIEDIQVDKRFHGGPEKALHQFALRSYEKIIKRHPLLYKTAIEGSIGENISINGMHDDNVFIGDIYQMGEVKLQVNAPRIPCWKISEKIGQSGLDKFISDHAITGWYYRVLSGGKIKTGDTVERLERHSEWLSVSQFMKIVNNKDCSIEDIAKASQATGLDPEWKEKLERRVEIKKSDDQDSANI
jgi:MOSC domain-containing protein YiiM